MSIVSNQLCSWSTRSMENVIFCFIDATCQYHPPLDYASVTMSTEYAGWPASNCLPDGASNTPDGCSTVRIVAFTSDKPAFSRQLLVHTKLQAPFEQQSFTHTAVSGSTLYAVEITNFDPAGQWQAVAISVYINRVKVIHRQDISNSGQVVVVPFPV